MKNPDREHAKKGTQFYTYLHSTLEGKPFYVGKGRKERAWLKAQRSAYWNRVVEKHGLAVQILAFWDTEQEAFDHEKLLILCFRDMGCALVNFTDGGEGPSGHVHSPETRAKLSAAGKGRQPTEANKIARLAAVTGKKRPPEVVEKIRLANLGKTRTEEVKQKLSAVKTGKKVANYPKGRKSRVTPEGYVSPTAGMARPDDVREKIRATMNGVPHTEERKAALKAAWVRRKQNQVATLMDSLL